MLSLERLSVLTRISINPCPRSGLNLNLRFIYPCTFSHTIRIDESIYFNGVPLIVNWSLANKQF